MGDDRGRDCQHHKRKGYVESHLDSQTQLREAQFRIRKEIGGFSCLLHGFIS